MYCWPRLLVKIDPKRSFFTFGPPPPSGQKYVEGCLWASPGLLLGCSWLRLGCSWLLLGCSWAAPGCSWVALAFSWAAPGLLLGWSWAAPGRLLAAPGLRLVALRLLLGFSRRLLGCSWASPGCSWTAPGCCWLRTHRHISIRTSRLEDRRAGRCILRRRDSRCVVSERHRAGVLGLGCPMHGELARPASPHEVGEGALTAVCPPAGPNLPAAQ